MHLIPDEKSGRILKRNQSKALLTGSPVPTLLTFAAPIILGNVFQQLYNVVDAIVVGKLLGDLPLAGISVASPVMDILYALIIGGSIGIGVLVGQLCGAMDWARLKRVHATALLGGTGLTAALSLLGVTFAGPILLAQGTDAQTVAQATAYLGIILGGMIFCFFYNYYAAVLRSYGDSRTPFVVLLVSSTLHALLDVLLCGTLRLGIRGVACSTVFCQLFSSVWLVAYTYRRCPELKLRRDELRFDRREAGAILAFAWAAALQQAVVMIGRFLVQGMLTGLGDETVTGYNMGMRVEQFAYCFPQGVSAAMVVGIAQNLGHGDRARVRRFYRAGAVAECTLWVVICLVCATLAPRLIGAFSDNPAVIDAGASYTGTMAFFYLASYLGEIIQSFFRGIGRLRLTMFASGAQVLLRVILSYFFVPLWGIYGICAAVSTGWILLVLIEGAYSLRKVREFRME